MAAEPGLKKSLPSTHKLLSPVRVSKDDHFCFWIGICKAMDEPAAVVPAKQVLKFIPRVGEKIQVPVGEHQTYTVDFHLDCDWQTPGKEKVAVAPDCLHRCDLRQPIHDRRYRDIAGMQNQINLAVLQFPDERRMQLCSPIRDVGIRK